MYDILLDINGVQLRMNRTTGYIISTISGLTGTSAHLETAQNTSNFGEAYIDGSVEGITLQILGKVEGSDTDKAKRQKLLDTVLPLGRGSLTLYEKNTVTSRLQPYRVIDVVVKETPTLSTATDKDVPFSFELYAPRPVWKQADEISIELQGTATEPTTVKVAGQAPAEYDLEVKVASNVTIQRFTLYEDWTNLSTCRYLYVDFTKYRESGVTARDTIRIKHIDGRLTCTINGENANRCIYSQSRLDMLAVGAWQMQIKAGGNSKFMLKYYPSYVGVVYDGV